MTTVKMYAKSDMLGSILDIRHDRTGSARQDWQSTIGSYDHLWLLTWLTSVFFRLKVALDFGDNASLSPTFPESFAEDPPYIFS
jgi:hypothetical protein